MLLFALLDLELLGRGKGEEFSCPNLTVSSREGENLLAG
jgi:hypothetical protein